MKKILGIILSLIIIGLISWFVYQKIDTNNKNTTTNVASNGSSTAKKNQENPILVTPIENFDKNNPEDRKKLIYKIQYSGKEGLIKGDIFDVPKELIPANNTKNDNNNNWIAKPGVNGYGTRFNNLVSNIKSGKLTSYSTIEEYLLLYYFDKIKESDFQVSKIDSLKLNNYSLLRNVVRLYFVNSNKLKSKEIINHLSQMKFFVFEPQKGSMEEALYELVKNKGEFSKDIVDKISVMPVYSEDNLSLILRMIMLNNEEDVVKIKKIYDKGFATMNGLLDQLTVQSIVNKYENRFMSRQDKIRANFLEWTKENQLEHVLGFMYLTELNNNTQLQAFANKLNSLMLKVSDYSDNKTNEYIKDAELLIQESQKMPTNSFYLSSFPYFILANVYTYSKEYNKSVGILEDMRKNYKVVGFDGNTYGYNNTAFIFAHYGQNYLEVKNYDKALYYYDLEIERQPLSNYMTIYRKAIEELKTTGKTGYTLWNNN